MTESSAAAKRVLIVEDDADQRDLLVSIFGDTGVRIETARDGTAAISQIPILKPDLILLDMMLPGFSGIDVLEQLQAGEFAKIPVVVLTAVSRSEFKNKIDKYPNVVEFLEKPADAGVIKEAVLRNLARR